uniref:Integrator complex subunit 7 n=3 Tax=Mesocestoides corti TaxID=53468 RepID=A0A5K3F0T7_MESCO
MHDVNEIGRDAAISIMELNKGLSSPNLGEQCKTIAEFPSIFEQFPFPVVINSIFLKIAELFREGNNFVRLGILRASTDCRSQLEKLTISDDIVRKLIPLTDSNDPTARALTLRLFGVLSRIVKDNISVHHVLMSKLESHYEVELSAAIWTAYEFASISKAFAVSLCPILCDLLSDFTTDIDTKLKLIPLGEYAYHDMVFLPKMRKCLVQLLSSHTTTRFVTIICDTLTSLEIHSPIYTSNQIELLLTHFRSASAVDVRTNLLSNLINLANKLPNQWDSAHISQLCETFLETSTTDQEKATILMVFYHLTSSVNAAELLSCANPLSKPCVSVCVEHALTGEVATSSSLLPNALSLACKISRCIGVDAIFDSESVAAMLVAAHAPAGYVGDHSGFSSSWILSDSGPPLQALRLLYSELLKFFEAFPSYVSVIGSIELFKEVRLSGSPRMALLCQFLGRICENDRLAWLPEPSELLTQLRTSCNPVSPTCGFDQLLQVCVLVFRVANGLPLSKEQQHDLLECLARATDDGSGAAAASATTLDPWIVYKLACKASLHKQPRFAAELFEQLTSLAITEKNISWLRGLAAFNCAHADLFDAVSDLPLGGTWVPKLISAITTASASILEAQQLVLAADGHTVHRFQTAYFEIRSVLLSCLARMCNEAFQAGAFANSGVCSRWQQLRRMNAALMKSEGDHTGKITSNDQNPLISLRSLLPLWKGLEEKVSALTQQCIDADPGTLRHLNAILDLVHLFIEILTKCGSPAELKIPEGAGLSDCSVPVSQDSFESAVAILRQLVAHSPLSASLLVNLATHLVSQSPANFPSLFFTRCQSTQVRLVLLPSTNNSDTLTLSSGASLVLRVMGVVTQSQMDGQRRPLRAVTAVKLILNLQHHQGPGGNTNECLGMQLLPVRGDFFSGEFCVDLPSMVEVCRLTVEAILLDDQQRKWKLGNEGGAMASLNVRIESVGNNSAKSVGDTRLVLQNFNLPLPMQVEGILTAATPSQ